VPVVCETPRLILREFTPDDLDALVTLDADPAVMHFINGGRPTPRSEMESDILPAFLAYHRRPGGYGFFAAVEKESGSFIGWFHLRPPTGGAPDDPELGYRFVRSAWGNGYATEGARALIDRAFAELGANRVHAEAMAVHTASRAVMERAGLRFVRLFHQDWPDRIPGDEEGDVEYALTREEWLAERG